MTQRFNVISAYVLCKIIIIIVWNIVKWLLSAPSCRRIYRNITARANMPTCVVLNYCDVTQQKKPMIVKLCMILIALLRSVLVFFCSISKTNQND